MKAFLAWFELHWTHEVFIGRRSSTWFNAGKFYRSPPLATLGVKSLAFFSAVSIEVASFITFLKSRELSTNELIRWICSSFIPHTER